MELFGLRVKDIAEKTGLTRATISRHLNGVAEPRRQTVETFAMATGKTYDEVKQWFDIRRAERQLEIAERRARWEEHCRLVGK